MPGTIKHQQPSTPLPDDADAERMHKYIQDRRVVGVGKKISKLSSASPFSVTSSLLSSSPNAFNSTRRPQSTTPKSVYFKNINDNTDTDNNATDNNTLTALADPQYDPLIQPALIRHEITSSPAAQSTIARARFAASRIIAGEDDRVIVVVGPCSIHSPEQAIEYAKLLKEDIPKWDGLLVIMRSYL